MRLAAFPSRLVILGSLILMLWGGLGPRSMPAQEAPLSEEEQREQIAAERFLELLLRRPSTGTALERVFGHHVARGSLTELLDDLAKKADEAQKAGNEKSAGNHWMVAGLLQLQRGEEAEAAKALARAEAVLKENPLAAYHHGQALLLLGKDEDAAQAMQRAIDLKPPRQDYLNIATQLGALYQRTGQADQALEIWKQLEASFPGDDGVRQRIARVLTDEGDLANALKRYEELAKEARSPNDRVVYALRAADLRVQLGQKDQAMKDLEALLTKLRPGSYLYAEARRRIENAFLDSGDYAGLTEYYEKWVGEHPDDVGAVLRLARTLSIQGRAPEALKWLEKAIERSPSDTAPRLTLIDTYIAEGRFGDAAAQYEKLAEMEPNNPDHLVRWGQVVFEDPKLPKEDRKTKAAEIWKRLAEARPEDAVIQSQVADLLRGAELTEQAIAGYRKAIELAPNEPQYKEYLGEYLHRLDRHEEALPVWRSIAEGDLRTRENLVRLAEVLHQFDEPEEASKTLAEACEMNPTITERLRYAEWLRDAESYDKALKQLELAATETDTVDDRDKVFSEEVKTYQAAGQLEDRIAEARKKAEAGMTDGELWRRLAILCEANNQSRESLEAIEKALEHSGDSIQVLDVAARMYESSGRLREAVEKRKLLADRDRRFRSGHLQRLASLYLRTGQAEEAIETGKLLVAGGGGSIESFRFYADLCGQLGRTEERLDTYRRCVRINPRSAEALELLASQLSEDFKTEQAIELYWNMLDSAADLDKRRAIVQSLTDLYLRSNRLDQLISRLEIRGRESGDRRGTIDLIASAYEQAGDLGLAREALESLLREQGRDTLLLDRLVGLAEKAGEIERAVELQRQLLRLAPSRQTEAKLATLLIDIGAMDEAEVLWRRLTEHAGDKSLLNRNLNRLFAAGETAMAIRLVKQVLENDPDDWESRFHLMVLEAANGDWEKAAKTAEALRAMNVQDTALPTDGKPYQPTRTVNGRTYPQPPLKYMRTQQLYEIRRILDERYGYSSYTSLPNPMDYGHAKLMALWIELKHDQVNLKKHLAEAEKKAKAEGATAEDVWNWYNTVSIAQNFDSPSRMNSQKPETWGPVWKLVEVDPQSGSASLVSMLYSRWGAFARERETQLEPLPEDKLEWLKQQVGQDDSSDFATYQYGGYFSWPMVYDSEMRIAGRANELERTVEDYLAETVKNKDIENAIPLLVWAQSQGGDDQLWSLIELLRNNPQDPTIQRWYGSNSNLNASCLGIFASQDRIDKKLSKGPADPVYRKRVMALLDGMLDEEASKPIRRRSVRLSSLGQPRSTYRIIGSVYHEAEIAFPPQGLGPDDDFIRTLWTLQISFSTFKGGRPEALVQHFRSEQPEADPRLKVLRKIVAASLFEWNKQTGEAIEEISEAVKIAEEELPHQESELRLMWVDLLLRQGQKRQALEVIDGLSVYDQNTMAVREFAAAKLAAALDDKDRARAATQRLFGVRMDTDAQLELAKLMRSLEMHELASDLERRMRSRGGSNTEQLNSLMTYFVAEGDKEQAAEVAIELLRRTVPTRRASSNSTTVAQARRRSALQTLANVGRLTSLIQTTEERLERSPKSQRIRGELAEMYVAAGQTAKAQELLADSFDQDTQSLAALEQAARQLVSAGKMDEACDAYLKILPRKPDLFRNDYYEITRPFEQAKRLDDLVDMILKTGIERFYLGRIGELCETLMERDKDSKKFKPLYLGMLKAADANNNASWALNQVVDGNSPVFGDQEMLQKTQEYMVKASVNSTQDWYVLFNGYSTSQDGRHKNAAMELVEAVTEDEKKAQALEDLIRKNLKEHDDWHEGRAWLGTLLAARKKYDEAKTLLEPLLDEQTKPAPTYTVFWLIGSLIDKHKPMQELAVKMYRHSLEKHKAEIFDRGSDFQYTLANRACQLFQEIGQKAEARELLLEGAAELEKDSRRYSSDPDYNAYRKIRGRISIIEGLAELDYPVDALRMVRTVDMSLFDQAGRYQSNLRENFERQRDQLLNKVRKLGGLVVVETMIAPETNGPQAVDLGLSIGEWPFTERGIQSLWIEMLEEARSKPDQKDKLADLAHRLKELHEKRPKDDSAALASAVAAGVTGDSQPLRQLIANWLKATDEEQIDDPAYRRQALILGLVDLNRSESSEDRQLVDSALAGPVKKWNWEQRMLLFAEIGRQAIEQNDFAAAGEHWRSLLSEPQSRLVVLDLAQAAAAAKMPTLSCDAAVASVSAPDKALSLSSPRPSANSLGSLLSTQNQQGSSSSSNSQSLDPAEVRFAQKLMELDGVWRTNQVRPKLAADALMKIVFPETTGGPYPFCVPVVVRQGGQMVADSIFDRLAKRAKAAQITDQIVAKLAGHDSASHLLAGLALLRNEQFEQAQKRYNQVNPEGLNALPKEAVLTALLPALDNDLCREDAVRIGVAFVKQNKPTQRYQDVTPFDSLALLLARRAVRNKQLEPGFEAINDYLEITQHDNDRYSSGTYGLTRRITQLNNVTRLLVNTGQTAKALEFAALRQPLFDMGLDTSLDDLGAIILQRIENMKNRKRAYKVLTDWTLVGDGPLNRIFGIVSRQPLPDWIPESVSRPSPNFSPVASQTFPIVSNYYAIAKLAAETGQMEELLNRLSQAHQKQRAGSAEALAIAMAVFEQPVPKELLAEIEKRMDEIRPEGNQAKSAVPLPMMQLATILASNSEHSEWSQRIAKKFESHGHRVRRQYVMPWLFRFQHEQNWLPVRNLEPARLSHWLASSSAQARQYAEEVPPPTWLTDGTSQVQHLCGIFEDRNWFRYPLDGDFEFHIELQDGNWRESSLIANGLRFTMGGTAKTVEVVADGNRGWMRFPTETVETAKWNKYRFRFEGEFITLFVNDVPIYREPRSSTAPWIALHATGYRMSAARNIQITGNPQIATAVNLLSGDELRGWSGHYYGERLPESKLDDNVHEPDARKPARVRTGTKPAQLDALSWTMKNGELISGNVKRPNASGPQSQSVIRYERPLGDGETLTYEFYYEAGQLEVHPAIGRTAYLLRPEGVSLHWMTEPQSKWKTPHDFEVPADAENPTKIPLKEDDWNQVSLELQKDRLQIRVNDVLVFDQTIEILPQGTIFGLFHYADQTKVRVRNARLTGPWPETMPENLLSQSRETSANKEIGNGAADAVK